MEGFIASARIRRANAFGVRTSVRRPRVGYPKFFRLYGKGQLVTSRRNGLLFTGPGGGNTLRFKVDFGAPSR